MNDIIVSIDDVAVDNLHLDEVPEFHARFAQILVHGPANVFSFSS